MKLLKTICAVSLLAASSIASADATFSNEITVDDNVGYNYFSVAADMTDVSVESFAWDNVNFMDSDMFVFEWNNGVIGALVGENDDNGGLGTSSSGLDSYVEMTLNAGSYVVAVSDYNLNEQDARDGFNTNIDMYSGRYSTYDVVVLGQGVSAVPEPSVLALMFGGLGLVGLMARRSRKA